MKELEKKSTIVFLICLVALLGSFAYATLYNYEGYLLDMPLTIAVIGFFLAGTVFFGTLAFLPHLLYGLTLGYQKNAAIILYFFPIAIATYAGVRLGFLLMDDFKKKKYFLEEFQSIIMMLGVAIILSIVIEISLPVIISIWPQDMWGLELKEGKNIGGLIEELTKYIRN